jgi:hypothetical protein
MNKIITIVMLALLAVPVLAAPTKKKVATFGLTVPSYAVQPNISHAEKRKQKALLWAAKHFTKGGK